MHRPSTTLLLALVAAHSAFAETKPTAHSNGLHGYIGFDATRPPAKSEFSAGMGFYSAVWPLIDEPLANFQIGLAGCWITPNNSDNKDTPLAPEGTLARKWKERGPTWSSVFQTVEGGLGYWAGNHFRYGPPKFSMNATPQCYDYEVGSPGWSFFYHNEALPDHQLGIAQLSNRLLIPPDALPFAGHPNGEFLGYTWMALPFTNPVAADEKAGTYPTGDQSWTCFLSAANFKGPIAYYIPETWSKIGKIFNYPYDFGRGLDARPGNMGGGAMEINTVPRFDAADAAGAQFSKIPKLQFPVDAQGRTLLVEDVTYYSKAALADAFQAWRDGGPACTGQFGADEKAAWKSTLTTHTPHFDQDKKAMTGVSDVFDTKVFPGNVWGLQWSDTNVSPKGTFPQFYKAAGDKLAAIPATDAPAELASQSFKLAQPGQPYTSPVSALQNATPAGAATFLSPKPNATTKDTPKSKPTPVEAASLPLTPPATAANSPSTPSGKDAASTPTSTATTPSTPGDKNVAAPKSTAWTTPGPKAGPFTTKLTDGSVVTYYWYRFVDQPSFQQYAWPADKKAQLQALVEKIHATWPIDRAYMPPPTQGTLVTLDAALLVTPPKGLEVGYVPIVTGQAGQ